jgi:hypothetical protein
VRWQKIKTENTAQRKSDTVQMKALSIRRFLGNCTLKNESSGKFDFSKLSDSKLDQLIKSRYERRVKSGYFEKEERRNSNGYEKGF